LPREPMRAPVAADLLDVGRVRDLEQASPVGVHGVEIGLSVADPAGEDDLASVRRPTGPEAADARRVVVRAAAAADGDLLQTAAEEQVGLERAEREIPEAPAVEVEDAAVDGDLLAVRRPVAGFGVVHERLRVGAVGIDRVDLLLAGHAVVAVDDDLAVPGMRP